MSWVEGAREGVEERTPSIWTTSAKFSPQAWHKGGFLVPVHGTHVTVVGGGMLLT